MPLTKRTLPRSALDASNSAAPARQQALAHGGAERGGLRGHALELVADPAGAVGQPDEGASAGAPSFVVTACAPIGVWQLASSACTSARSAVRHVSASRSVSDVGGLGHVLVGRRAPRARGSPGRARARTARHRSGVPSSPRPSRSRPAPDASTIASKSPSASRLRRVSTLPRRSRTSRSGRRASSAARRRRLAVPTTAPSASSSSDSAPQSASRASARSGHAHDREPVGQLRRHVLRRVHGEVDRRRRSSASSISLTKRDLSVRPSRGSDPLSGGAHPRRS